jgi:hypothetical protein
MGRAVLFPHWEAALMASSIVPERRWRFATEISRFLRYCHILDAPVTKPRAREYLAKVPLLSARPLAREALRWFFAAACGSADSQRRPDHGLLRTRRRDHKTLPTGKDTGVDATTSRVGWIGSR